MSELWRFLRALIRSVRRSRPRRTAPSMSVGAGSSEGRSIGCSSCRHSGSSVPLTMKRLSASSAVCSVASADGQRLPPVGRFGLGLDDVERRERADFDARLVVFDELVGELQRALGHVNGAAGEHEIPVGVAHVGQRLRDGRAQRLFGNLTVDLRDRKLLPRLIDEQPAQQRLRVGRRQARRERRVEGDEGARGILPVVVPGEAQSCRRTTARSASRRRCRSSSRSTRAGRPAAGRGAAACYRAARSWRWRPAGMSCVMPAICRSTACGLSRSTDDVEVLLERELHDVRSGGCRESAGCACTGGCGRSDRRRRAVLDGLEPGLVARQGVADQRILCLRSRSSAGCEAADAAVLTATRQRPPRRPHFERASSCL